MSQDLALALWALLAFQIKHFICDFVLQTQFQVRTKGIYGHFGGIIHAGFHMIGSVPALIILTLNRPSPLITIVIVMAVEFVIHYHVDWYKARTDSRVGWTDKDAAYWIVFGIDQLVHQITYLGIVYFLLR